MYFDRLSVLKNNLAKYRDTYSIFPNLHQIAGYYYIKIRTPDLDRAPKYT